MKSPIVGIDFGTTNSSVAVVRDGKPHLLADARGKTIHPSIVSFVPNGEILVGYPGKARGPIDPRNTIFSAKRILGRRFFASVVQTMRRQCAHTIIEGEDGRPVYEVRARPEALSDKGRPAHPRTSRARSFMKIT